MKLFETKLEKGIAAGVIVVLLVQIALCGVAIYVIVHFVRKWW